MRQSRWVTAVVACMACVPNTTTADFNEAEWQLVQSLELKDALPSDPFNPLTGDVPPQVTAQAEQLGQALFFDQGLSGGDAGVRFGVALPGGAGVSCATCHSPLQWFSDARTPREVSVGLGLTARNSPGLVDVANYRIFAWDGRGETLPNQCIVAYTAKKVMAGTPLLLAQRLLDVPGYASAYDSLFPSQPLPPNPNLASTDALNQIERNASYLWAAYLRRLQSHDAAFDRFVRGDALALTASQQRGLKLFIGNAGCIECHNGPMFSDSQFHVTGVGQTSPSGPATDNGRADALTFLACTGPMPPKGCTDVLPFRLAAPGPVTPADVGAFRTKSLRHVTETGPYFHAGQYATLRDVIWFYVRGGDHAGAGTVSPFLQPLSLSDDDQADLEAFLHSLTGLPPDPSLGCDSAVFTVDPSALPLPDGGVVHRERPFPTCPGVVK